MHTIFYSPIRFAFLDFGGKIRKTVWSLWFLLCDLHFKNVAYNQIQEIEPWRHAVLNEQQQHSDRTQTICIVSIYCLPSQNDNEMPMPTSATERVWVFWCHSTISSNCAQCTHKYFSSIAIDARTFKWKLFWLIIGKTNSDCLFKYCIEIDTREAKK